MTRTQSVSLALFALALFAGPVSAQVATGTPPFGSFAGGPDIVNLATSRCKSEHF